MRRSRVNSASLASASIAAHTLSPIPHPENRQSQGQIQTQNRNLSRNHQNLSLSLIRLLVVIAVIASQFPCILGSTTAATTDAATTVNITTNSNTENNFYFDEHNTNTNTTTTTTKTISFITAAADGADTISEVSQMPAEILQQSTTTATNRTQLGQAIIGVTEANANGNGSGNNNSGTTIKNYSTNSIDLLLSTAITTKGARSTVKQPNDSTRSRNHWTSGSGSSTDAERSRTFRNKYHHENHYGPFFEEPSNLVDPGKTLVSAVHLFTEAILNCRVGMLKDKTVMWVRRTTEKVSLLTVGNVTYSGDPRIRVKFQYPNNWRLMINPTQREDAGIYMCQVSTHPPRVFTTNLTILEPPLRIIDEHERDVGDRYYKSGSTVDLQCQISRNFFQKERYNIFKSIELTNSNNKLLNDTVSELNLIGDANQTHLTTYSSQELEKYFTNFITWAKDEEALQAQTNRRSSVSDKWLTSRISIPDAKLSDSGNYSCSLGRLFTVIVQVQVLTGELPAAVQHNLAGKSTSCYLLSWSLFIIVICYYFLKSSSSQFRNIKILGA